MHDIIRHLISSERIEEAIGISHAIPDDSQKDLALQRIVLALTSTSFHRAIIVAHMIKDPDIRTSTLEMIDEIESQIDYFQQNSPEIKFFVLPGSSLLSSHIDISRTICRRAERLCVKIGEKKLLNNKKNLIL